MNKKLNLDGNAPGYLLLLPRCFRFIGLGLIVLTVALTFVGLPVSDYIYGYTLRSLLILALVFISSARRKIEDELSIYLRFQAVCSAFFMVVVIYLIRPLTSPLVDKLLGDPIRETGTTGFLIIFILLFLYIFNLEVSFRLEKFRKSRKG